MRHFLLFTAFFISIFANAQITYTSVGAGTASAYDSSYNFDADKLDALKGQMLFFIPYSSGYANAPKNLDGFFTIPEAGRHHEGGKSALGALKHAPLVGGAVYAANQRAEQNAANHNTDQDKEKHVYKGVKVSVNGASYYQTPIAEIAGKYFKIIDFIDSVNEEHHHGFMVKLASKDNPADVFFYKLADTKSEVTSSRFMPNFITVGYFEKQKKLCLNKNFYVKRVYAFNGIKDVAAIGKTVRLEKEGEQWQCYDVTLLNDNTNPLMIPAALLKNSAGNHIAGYIINTITTRNTGDFAAIDLNTDFITEAEHSKIEKEKADKEKAKEEALKKQEAEQVARDQKQAEDLKKQQAENIKKYGPKNGGLINDHKVAVGMTKAMCIASWGEPTDINTTTMAGSVHEQWVYSMTQYLYFENGILTTIQN